MINEGIQKSLINQNYKPLEIFANKFASIIQNNVPFQVGDYCGTMGCKLMNDNKYLIKSDISCVYVVFLKVKEKEQDIVLYVGESDTSLGNRIGRLIKQAFGDNREDESHSAGQLLYEKFTTYGREDIWKNNLFVKYISLREIKNIFGDIALSHTTIYGDDYYKISKLENKTILKYFESRMIDIFAPISNKVSQRFKNTNLYGQNLKLFNLLCNSVDTNIKHHIKMKPLLKPTNDRI